LKNESKPFNPLLAKMFFLGGYIEEWGRGTVDMIEDTIEHGLPEPEFEDTGTAIVVTFRKSKLTEEYLSEIDINDRQQEIIKYLHENAEITSSKYAEMFDISQRTARNDLVDLVDKEILNKKGKSRKTTVYVLAEI